jgi:hypothetical protein
LLSLSLVACSDGDGPGANAGTAAVGQNPGTGGAATAPAEPRGSTVSFDGTRIEAQIIARDVAPGAEQHVCVTVELPNQDVAWVNQVRATLTGGSHHLIVDRRPKDTPLGLEPQVCLPTTGADATRLMVAQQAETSFMVPSGAALALEPHQMLFMQLHYFNTGGAVRDITGTLDLVLADPNAPTPTEAKSMFTGSMDINLQPNSPGQARAFVMPMLAAGSTRNVFALTSHTHHLGVKSTIERVPSAEAPSTTPIHVSTSWDEPPLTIMDPPMTFDGSDGLRLICNYENTTSRVVTFGTRVDDEMCFMWVYYFDG